MQEYVDRLPDALTRVADELDREFERLLVESSTLAFRVAYGVLRRREDAEDVAQEAFIKAQRNFRRLRDRGRFRSWLVRLTWRLAIDRQRADRRRWTRDTSHAHQVPIGAIVDPAIESERNTQVWKAIDELPEKLRLPLVLASIEGHDVREISRLLQVPEGTVKSRLFHARERMKASLKCVI